MRIGIDIDGTITTPFYWLDFYNQYFKRSINAEDITSAEHHIAFQLDRTTFDSFRSQYLFTIHELAKPRPLVKYHMNSLYFEGHQLIIVTARETALEATSQNWLEKHDLLYHDMYHLGSVKKLQLALKLNLDLFLEDRLETALALVKWHIPVILFNTPYNQGMHHPMIFRVDSWKEAYQRVQRLNLLIQERKKEVNH